MPFYGHRLTWRALCCAAVHVGSADGSAQTQKKKAVTVIRKCVKNSRA
jgi:hypothetical protein